MNAILEYLGWMRGICKISLKTTFDANSSSVSSLEGEGRGRSVTALQTLEENM